jgi:hypothetical protein
MIMKPKEHRFILVVTTPGTRNMKTALGKLDDLVKLSTNCRWRIGGLGPVAGKAGEREITATLENLKAIKDLVPLIESDVRAMSSLP